MLELCENDSDEQCQGPGLLVAIITTILSSFIFILTSLALSCVRLKKEAKTRVFLELQETNEIIGVPQLSGHSNFHDHQIIVKLALCRITDIKKTTEMVLDIYDRALEGNPHKHQKDEFFMTVLGTNFTASFFYDCVDGDLSTKIKFHIYTFLPKIYNAWMKWHAGYMTLLIQGTASLSLRYSDLSKDLLLIYIIWLQLGNYEVGSFPHITFWMLVACTFASEMANLLTTTMVHKFPVYMVMCKILIFPIAPLMPAYWTYEILHLELMKLQFLKSHKKLDSNYGLCFLGEQIKETDNKIYEYQKSLSKLQLNEHILETVPQLTILLLFLQLSYTTSKVVNNLESIFIDGNIYLVYLLITMSLVSLTKGQIDSLKANRNGCSRGIVILIPYFSIGITSRYKKPCKVTLSLSLNMK